MDDILVIQMARMGDFLQTTPLISRIKNSPSFIFIVSDSDHLDPLLEIARVFQPVTVENVYLLLYDVDSQVRIRRDSLYLLGPLADV